MTSLSPTSMMHGVPRSVFSLAQQLFGMVRMTPAPFPFMLESEFSGCLVGSHRVRKDLDTAEITRLAVDPAIVDRGLSAKLMRTIFKGMYQWTLANNIRYTYLVVENRLLRVGAADRLALSCDRCSRRPSSSGCALGWSTPRSRRVSLRLQRLSGPRCWSG